VLRDAVSVAAIGAVHDEAPTADTTDWPQILTLFELLELVGPNPMVTLTKRAPV
jgi:predicted RNA polymerase sigma factor